MKRPTVELVIDRLVFHGVHAERRVTAQALERELTRLFRERGVPPLLRKNAVVSRLDGGGVRVSANAKPADVGIQVARAVYGGFK